MGAVLLVRNLRKGLHMIIGPGGTRGGWGKFISGCILAAVAAWLFCDSVRMTTGQYGMFGNAWHGFGHQFGNGVGNFFDTTSMGIVFAPLAAGIFCLAVNAKRRWAWWLTFGGMGFIVLEMLSRVHFAMNIKTSHFILMLVMGMVGLGMIFSSYQDHSNKWSIKDGPPGPIPPAPPRPQ